MSWWRAHRVDVALVVLVLAVAAPMVQELKTQQASRMALTAALWDDRSIRIDDYPVGVDRAERGGHVYSDKAPGQPVFAIPAYAAYRALGGEPATVLRPEGNLGLWAASVWSSALPIGGLLLVIRRAARRVDPATGLAVAVVTFGSTLLLPFASVLFGHALAAALAVTGWYLVARPSPSDRALLGAGALLGAAVLTEYTLGLAVVAVALHVAVTERARVWRLVAGGAPFVVALLLYQWAAFGDPFTLSYASSSFGSAARELGDQDKDPALLANALRVLAGERGFLVVTPVLAMGVAGMVALVRRSVGSERSAYLAAAASAAALVAVQCFWSNPTGGDSPGPRYATAAAAFLAPGLAVAWGRWRRWCVALAAVGGLVMVAATWSDPLEARDSTGAVGIWLGHLFRGEWGLTVYEMVAGAWAVVLLPVGAVAAALGLRRAQAVEARAVASAGALS